MAALDNAFLVAEDGDGHRISGGKLYIFDAGTTDPATAYTTSALSGSFVHDHPVVADANGEFAAVYLAAGDYKIRITTAAGVTVQEIDNYNVPDLTAIGAINFPVVSKTADFSITDEDYGKVFEVNASAAPGTTITVTAPAGTAGNGLFCYIANVGSSGTVVIQASGAETFDGGASSYTLDEQNELVGIVSRGASGWRVLAVPSPTIPPPMPQGRLTLTTATPVLTSDVTSATSIYYTPYAGRFIPIWDGVKFVATAFSELTLALNNNSGHTGYHQSGKNFDLFVINDAGTIRLGTGPAWTNDTTRADAITRLQGILVNNASIVIRFGTASGNTVTVDANEATLVGTARMSADGTTLFIANPAAAAGGGNCRLFLWNAYNRRQVVAVSRDSTNTWDGNTSSAWRSANTSTSNRIGFVTGAAEDAIDAAYTVHGDIGGAQFMGAGIALDATNAIADGCAPWIYEGDADIAARKRSLIATYSGVPLTGYHFIQAVEYGTDTSVEMYGDNGAATLYQMALRLRGWF